MFANAPVTRAPNQEYNHEVTDHTIVNENRKPIDGECPICVFDMSSDEDIVWCKASCGQNFHKLCFDQWRRSKNGGQVTCVYCRAIWQEDEAKASKNAAPGSLANLKDTAPKVGSYKNIGHLPMYQEGKT